MAVTLDRKLHEGTGLELLIEFVERGFLHRPAVVQRLSVTFLLAPNSMVRVWS